jgi:predicted 3-demethylubiquinone-9 3-methyltransferase (glyoxalase superfamily)
MQKTTMFMMFSGDQCGKAGEAINFYISLFKNSEIKNIQHYQTGEYGGREGLVKLATFTLGEQEYMAIDSIMEHKFSFTPSISIYINCESDEEIEMLVNKLSEGGSLFMPLNNYGFSKKFAWLADRYGVSWQLNLAS